MRMQFQITNNVACFQVILQTLAVSETHNLTLFISFEYLFAAT